MRHPNDNGFAERRNAAAEARKKNLEKFAAAPKPDDPEMVAKRAELQRVAEARELRRQERDQAKKEAQARELAEAQAALEAANAAANAEAIARETESRERIARVVADEAERKAERDRRYAARKARRG